jgi:protein arginine N-methyltransferase 1
VSSATGYSLLNYGAMVNSEPRMSAYAQALRQAVFPGCRVFDIGAGPGVFAILACQYGAGSVVAIEPHDSVELLRALAEANACAEQIEIFQGHSSNYAPAEKADVIISDIRGTLPLFEAHIAAIQDARSRLLKPNGKLIPSMDILRLSVVDSAKSYVIYEQPWRENRFNIDLSAGSDYVVNNWSKVNLEQSNLLCEPQTLAVLDYNRISDANLASVVELVADRAGTAHGLLLWFDAELAPGITFSNAPGEPPQVYGQTFLPLRQPVSIAPGDVITAEIRANLVDGSYIWSWRAAIRRQGAAEAETTFSQSSFFAQIFTAESLKRRAGSFAPPVSPLCEIDRRCLDWIDGRRTLAELAEQLRAEFPDEFPSARDALNHVANLTQRYG